MVGSVSKVGVLLGVVVGWQHFFEGCGWGGGGEVL